MTLREEAQKQLEEQNKETRIEAIKSLLEEIKHQKIAIQKAEQVISLKEEEIDKIESGEIEVSKDPHTGTGFRLQNAIIDRPKIY